jgi:hypothetical protein
MRPLQGAAAALEPATAGMGRLGGYTPADYLVQHAGQKRSNADVPASTWDALAGATFSPDDTRRLASSAERLQLRSYAIICFQVGVAGRLDLRLPR